MSNPRWEEFLEAVPWFLPEDQVAEVGVSGPPGAWTPASAEFSLRFPQLEGLLQGAAVTPIMLSGKRYQLYSWPRAEGGSCA